jgi:heme-degrading monooxygenase HmoA
MRHFRVALFDVTSGSADDVLETVRAGFVPIFEKQPGFVRYEMTTTVIVFSIWETAAEAQRQYGGWVRAGRGQRGFEPGDGLDDPA